MYITNRKILLKVFYTFVDTLHIPVQQDEGVSVKHMFSVRSSKTVVDLVTFPDADKDPGFGVFQEVHGRFLFQVTGPGVESMEKEKMVEEQKKYAMDSGFDEDKVIVPTLESIRSGIISLPFRIQHSKDNPTHKMDWREDEMGRDFPHSCPILVPIGPGNLVPNTEITFDYNLS